MSEVAQGGFRLVFGHEDIELDSKFLVRPKNEAFYNS